MANSRGTPSRRPLSPTPSSVASTVFPSASDVSAVVPAMSIPPNRPRGKQDPPEPVRVLPSAQLHPAPPSTRSSRSPDRRRPAASSHALIAPPPAPASVAKSRTSARIAAPMTTPVRTHAPVPTAASPVRRPIAIRAVAASPDPSDMDSNRGHVGIDEEQSSNLNNGSTRNPFVPVASSPETPTSARYMPPATPPRRYSPQRQLLSSPERPLLSSPERSERDSMERPLLPSPERMGHNRGFSSVDMNVPPASQHYSDIPSSAANRSPSPRKKVQRKPPPSRFNGSAAPFSRTGTRWRPSHKAYGSNVSIPDVVGSDDPHSMERRLKAASGPVPATESKGVDESGQQPLVLKPFHPEAQESQATLVENASKANPREWYERSLGPPVTEKVGASKTHATTNLLPKDIDNDPDEFLHMVEKRADRNHGVSWEGLLNVGTLILLTLGILMLFAGYPLIDHFARKSKDWSKYGLGLGGTNGTGQIPQIPGMRGLVDSDTPATAMQWNNAAGSRFDLVFSDEFNTDGRTFYPGDDPFWEAANIWYGATGDYEWYSPEGVNTTGGALTLTLSQKETHNLNFQSGMLQSWNKFCFQGGYIEFNTLLPAGPARKGYWPAAWLMGNLGRAGYRGTTDGLWPYNYDSCDTGILKGQHFVNGSGPHDALHSNAPYAAKGKISKLPGMRSSSCTCEGEDHPGPANNVGRGASEIDVFEMQVQGDHTYASQSLQVAPFSQDYYSGNNSQDMSMYNKSISEINSYHGGPLQMSASVVTRVPDDNFAETGGQFVRYGLEYSPDWDGNGNGYIQWWMDGAPVWRLNGDALPPQGQMDIGQRLIPTEPMSIVLNLGISNGFQSIDWKSPNRVVFPAQMQIDYVRVYQPHGQPQRVSCDPSDHPTSAYIERHADLYYNPNITTYNKPWPRNALTGCSASSTAGSASSGSSSGST